MCDCKWMPIESAPRDGTRILLWDSNENYDDRIVVGSFYAATLYDEDSNETYIEDAEWQCDSRSLIPTHWMPLPAAPKDTGADKPVGDV